MSVIEVKNWSHSVEKKPLSLYHSSDLQSASDKPHILLIGGTHGDEPAGVQLAETLLKHLESLGNTDLPWKWSIIPCLNPDGYDKNQRTNGNGVDLNRNYPSQDWSPDHDKPRYFPGSSPGSEPEIASLVEWIKRNPVKLLVHFHAWEPCVVCTGSPALPLAKLLSDTSGYELQDHIGYPTSGSLSQFGWHDQQIPVICTEEDENLPPETTWERFGNGLIQLLQTPCPY